MIVILPNLKMFTRTLHFFLLNFAKKYIVQKQKSWSYEIKRFTEKMSTSLMQAFYN